MRLHFLERGLEEHREAVFGACLKNLVYDAQCEVERAPWLLQLLTPEWAALLAARLRQTLPRARGWRHRSQQCSLAFLLAGKGYSEAREALHRGFGVSRDGSVLAAREIIQLDGAEGLSWVCQQPLPHLQPDVRRQVLEDWIWEYEERAGKGAARLALAEDLPAASATGARADRRRAEREFSALSVSEVLDRIACSKTRYYIPGLRAWAKAADRDKLKEMSEALSQERAPDRLGHLLSIFECKPLPRFNPHLERLLALSDHQERCVRLRANRALAEMRHPSIRERAVSQLKAHRFLESEILPLQLNLKPGDAALLERELRVSLAIFDTIGWSVTWPKYCEPIPGQNC